MFRYMFLVLALFSQILFAESTEPTIVEYQNGTLRLQGELFMPKGKGPFPALLYNHGSAPGMLNSQVSSLIGPMFAKRGWVFFMPYRRGQGLSEKQGAYIMDEINSAKWSLFGSASKTMVRLLNTDHLSDQLAAFAWLKKQPFIQKERIATMGNSFGGIEVILGMSHADYCAGVDASGGADSWKHSDALQALMKAEAKKIVQPLFLFQAKNDYDLAPSKTLYSLLKKNKQTVQMKIYPQYGVTEKEGHSLPYKGAEIWFEDVFSFLNAYCPSELVRRDQREKK